MKVRFAVGCKSYCPEGDSFAVTRNKGKRTRIRKISMGYGILFDRSPPTCLASKSDIQLQFIAVGAERDRFDMIQRKRLEINRQRFASNKVVERCNGFAQVD